MSAFIYGYSIICLWHRLQLSLKLRWKSYLHTGLVPCTRERSHLGEVSLYSWSPVLQVWIQLLNSSLVKSSLVKLETSCTAILLPLAIVLCLFLSHFRTYLNLQPCLFLAAVDRYSRVVFPVFFFLFQFGYWIICMARTPQLPEDAILLQRNESADNFFVQI